MPGLRVQLAERAYTRAVRKHGVFSPQAKAASAKLVRARTADLAKAKKAQKTKTARKGSKGRK